MLSVALAMFLNEILSQSVPTRQTLAIHRLYVKQNLITDEQPSTHYLMKLRGCPRAGKVEYFITIMTEENNQQVCAYLDLIILLVCLMRTA